MPFDEPLRSFQSTAPWGREVVPSLWQEGGPYFVASDTDAHMILPTISVLEVI